MWECGCMFVVCIAWWVNAVRTCVCVFLVTIKCFTLNDINNRNGKIVFLPKIAISLLNFQIVCSKCSHYAVVFVCYVFCFLFFFLFLLFLSVLFFCLSVSVYFSFSPNMYIYKCVYAFVLLSFAWLVVCHIFNVSRIWIIIQAILVYSNIFWRHFHIKVPSKNSSHVSFYRLHDISFQRTKFMRYAIQIWAKEECTDYI